MPQVHICSINGMTPHPSSVSEYSVFGGTTGYTFLAMRPSASSSLSCFVIIFPVASGSIAWIWLNLLGPWRRYQSITDLYFPPIILTVSLTGQFAMLSSSDMTSSSGMVHTIFLDSIFLLVLYRK